MNHERGDPLRRIVERREERRRETAAARAVRARDELVRRFRRRVETTMIGAISAFEDVFGFLWGQGRPRHTLTGPEIEMDELREELRTRVLNLGNRQLRDGIAELDDYEVEWAAFHYDLADPEDARVVYGLDEQGNRRRPKYGVRADGSIITRGDERG